MLSLETEEGMEACVNQVVLSSKEKNILEQPMESITDKELKDENER